MESTGSSPRGLRAINTILALVVLALSLITVRQSMEITALHAEKAQAERELKYSVAKLATASLQNRREEIVRAAQWLNDFYRSPEGLQRGDGLWLSDQQRPDLEAITVWIFEVYLSARLAGQSEEESRRAVANAIRATDEWRRKHPGIP